MEAQHQSGLGIAGKNFRKYKTDPIPNAALMNLKLHISSTGCLEDGASRSTSHLKILRITHFEDKCKDDWFTGYGHDQLLGRERLRNRTI